jgi:hypothetical protein
MSGAWKFAFAGNGDYSLETDRTDCYVCGETSLHGGLCVEFSTPKGAAWGGDICHRCILAGPKGAAQRIRQYIDRIRKGDAEENFAGHRRHLKGLAAEFEKMDDFSGFEDAVIALKVAEAHRAMEGGAA